MSFRPCRNSHNIEYTIHENCPYSIQKLQISWTSSLWWLQMDNPHLPHHKEGVPAAVSFVRRNTRNLQKSFRETAYKSLIRPHVEYCSSVWDPHTLSDTQKIERIQRQAARYVTGDYRRSSSVSEMLHNLKWTNLSTRRSVNRLTMIYKILNGHSAITPNNFFEFNRTQTRKET